MFSSQGRWSTFFSEEDLQKPMLPDGGHTTGATDLILLDDHTGNISPKSRTSSTFESDGIRATLLWRSGDLHRRRRHLDARARGPSSPSDPRCSPAHRRTPARFAMQSSLLTRCAVLTRPLSCGRYDPIPSSVLFNRPWATARDPTRT